MWGPILSDVVPEDPVACTIGLLCLFDSVSFGLSAPTPRKTASFVSSLVWRSSPTYVRTLEESLGLEVPTASSQAARVLRSVHPLVLERFQTRPKPPFVFRFEDFSGRDDRRVQTLNALCRMLLLARPAFVQALVNGEIYSQVGAAVYRDAQNVRRKSDMIEMPYVLSFANADVEVKSQVLVVVRDFLHFEDSEIVALARAFAMPGVRIE